MYGSTDSQRLATRTMPSSSFGKSTGFNSKLSAVGSPSGRLFKCQARAISFSFASSR
jgi:hypothetical protein